MCQGAIVSIVRFDKKRVVLSGIGPHSSLIADNRALLEKRGWKEDAPDQSVVSYESDFSGGKWGRFTLEGGEPRSGDEKLARVEFKRISGSASALIRHIQKHKKIDNALVNLLTPSAQKVYTAATAGPRKVYYAAEAEARKVYYAAMAEPRKVYDAARAEPLKVYDAAMAEPRKVYDAATAEAFVKIFRNPKNRVIK